MKELGKNTGRAFLALLASMTLVIGICTTVGAQITPGTDAVKGKVMEGAKESVVEGATKAVVGGGMTKNESDGKKMTVDGARMLMDGSAQMKAELVKQDKIKKADMLAGEQMLKDGNAMVTKADSMMTGDKVAEGKKMMLDGAAKMMDARKTMVDDLKGKGLLKEEGYSMPGQKMMLDGQKMMKDGTELLQK